MVTEQHARRGRKSTLRERLHGTAKAKLVLPVALVGVLAAGLVATVAPASTPVSQSAVTDVTPAAPGSNENSLERASRLLAEGRPSLSAAAEEAASSAAQAKSASVKAAKEKAAKEKAAKAKAAKAKAAREKAARAKAAREKAAKARAARALVTPTASQLKVTGQRYTRVPLNVRKQPTSSAALVTVLGTGSKVSVTSTTKGSWTLVLHRGTGRWVHTEYLARSKPKAKAKAKAASTSSGSGGGLSTAPCSSGSGMESGLTRDAVRVHRAVCARYRQISSYGGMRADSDSYHSSGRAVDIMVSGSTGWAVARWVQANRKALGVSEIIYSQKIWTVQRGGEGWRSMSDRGNSTANHYDHVHVSVYGNSGSS